jgi:hypothetical protein
MMELLNFNLVLQCLDIRISHRSNGPWICSVEECGPLRETCAHKSRVPRLMHFHCGHSGISSEYIGARNLSSLLRVAMGLIVCAHVLQVALAFIQALLSGVIAKWIPPRLLGAFVLVISPRILI